MALLALRHRFPPHVRFHAYSGASRNASAHLYVRAGPWLGHMESDRDHRRVLPGGWGIVVARQPAVVIPAGSDRRKRSLGRVDARMVNHFAAAGLQLRDDS